MGTIFKRGLPPRSTITCFPRPTSVPFAHAVLPRQSAWVEQSGSSNRCPAKHRFPRVLTSRSSNSSGWAFHRSIATPRAASSCQAATAPSAPVKRRPAGSWRCTCHRTCRRTPTRFRNPHRAGCCLFPFEGVALLTSATEKPGALSSPWPLEVWVWRKFGRETGPLGALGEVRNRRRFWVNPTPACDPMGSARRRA